MLNLMSGIMPGRDRGSEMTTAACAAKPAEPVNEAIA